MPRSSFARGALNGAASGGSKLFQAILNADKAYQDGYTKEELAQSRIAQAAGVTAKNNAAAAQDEAETAIINGRPEVFNETLAARGGVTVPQVRAYRDYLQTGVIPERQLPGPPTEDGVGPGAEPLINPEAMTKLGQLIGQLGLLQGNVKDLNPAQLADADSAYSTMGLRDQVLGGQRTPQSVSEAVAAAAGKYQQGGAAAKAPAGFQWDASGSTLQPIPGGPKDPKAYPPKSGGGGAKEVDRDQVAILSQELFDVRARMAGLQGGDLARAQGDEAAIIAELKNAGVKDIGQLKTPKAGGPVKPPTEGQSKALLFGSRMAVADEILNEMSARGKDKSNLIKQGAEAIPGIGGALGMGANFLSTADQQVVEQAKRDFINAVLRRESGAAIAASEFANADRQYFPQPGDSPEVIRQKAINRRTAIEGFKVEIGEGLMPGFLSAVRGARAERQKGAKGQNRPGAQSGIYTAPAADVNRNVRVDY